MTSPVAVVITETSGSCIDAFSRLGVSDQRDAEHDPHIPHPFRENVAKKDFRYV
jgi:hypothetical protein